MHCRRSQRGTSVVEILGVVAMLAALVLATGPPLIEVVRRSRVKAAARHLAGELQLARSGAVGSGWQVRLAGYPGGASSAYSNQYRVMARQSSLVPWPAIDAAPFETATLRIDEWVDVGSLYPGVTISPTDSGPFEVTFDVRGAPFGMSLNFNPMQIRGDDGFERWLTVSAVGSVRIE